MVSRKHKIKELSPKESLKNKAKQNSFLRGGEYVPEISKGGSWVAASRLNEQVGPVAGVDPRIVRQAQLTVHLHISIP